MNARSSHRVAVLTLGAVLAGCLSDEPAVDAAALTPGIIGGAPSQAFAATGVIGTPQGLCTATLVAPDIVLTAAHCLSRVGASGVEFAIGVDIWNRARSIRVAQVAVHPDYSDNAMLENGHDLALARLSEPIDDIAPAVLYFGDASELVGERMRLVGYGAQGVDPSTNTPFGQGFRRTAWVTLADVGTETLGYDARQMAACHGDSGGPAFVDFGDSYMQVGVDSWGDPTCTPFGKYQRIDRYADWLASFGIPVTPRDVSCAEDGSCDGACESDPDCQQLFCPGGIDCSRGNGDGF